jgi:hypothetical protein
VRNLAGAARDQADRDDPMHGRRGVAVETAKELIGGGATDRLRVLGNDGDCGVEQVGQRDVVEADQRDLAFATRPAESVHAADRQQVLPREKSRRWVGQREHLFDRASGCVRIAQLRANNVLLERNPGAAARVSLDYHRKLGASSRSQAIERAVNVGLLESAIFPHRANLTLEG